MHRKLFGLTAFRLSLVAGLTLSLSATAWAAGREKAHYSFNGNPAALPMGNLVFDSQGNLYGTTFGGTGAQSSTAYRFAPKPGGGWSYSQIYVFDNPLNGTQVQAGLVADGVGNLYGTASSGGSNNAGVAFELTPTSNGPWTETILYNFGAYQGDAVLPESSLVFDTNGNLYGTTETGGVSGFGAVFELSPGSGGIWTESVVYSFEGAPNDGFTPFLGSLVFDNAGNLYGTTRGGPDGGGTVFELSPTSGSWTESVLYSFKGGDDGSDPWAGVTFDANGNLYGTTQTGGGLCGQIGCGTVFKLSPSTSGWTETIIHRFSIHDGIGPDASVIFDTAGNLYGTTFEGGTSNFGTVFLLKADSNGFWKETGSYSFNGRDGANPIGDVIFDAAGNIYGTTSAGGLGPGVVFEGSIGGNFIGYADLGAH